ncbi:hypothetical protein DEJ23_02195 [Curtobacterium sp. MCSS17_008]|nr:FHA domain-containing protein [Curtobacterium sp. MCSS17_008]PZF59838.1 hypothetical protein DEJ23_02195 [Curtobacterium sp. MCSS17_008]
MLPDGAIFCGECGRSVNVSANRRPAPAAPVDDTPPPPLRQPDRQGRHPDPASEAWLPEATLDPATRAWLTGEDRQRGHAGPAQDGRQSADRQSAEQPPAPVQAPAHVNAAPHRTTDRAEAGPVTGGRAGDPTPTGAGFADPEPPLDPDAYPASPDDPVTVTDTQQTTPPPDRPSHTGPVQPVTPRADSSPSGPERPAEDVGARPADPETAPPADRWGVPAWNRPAPQAPVPPSRPSWWVGRGATEAEPPVGEEPQDVDTNADQRPRPGDTAAVEPLVDRRPAPTPLIAPGSGPATCPVCGHTLEPDDIFCAECGAVRPTVTAAFTGPVVPLPMARPDWAADEEAPDEAPSGELPSDEEPDEAPSDELPSDELPSDDLGGEAEQPDAGGGVAPVAGAPVQGSSPATGDDVRAGQVDPVAPGEDPVRTAARDAHESLDTTPRTPTLRTRPPGRRAHVATIGDPDTAVPSAPVSPTVPSSAPLAGADGAPSVPTAAPLPPLPGSTGPVLPAVGRAQVPSSGETGFDDEEDVEETRIVAANTTNAPFVLHFSTGERAAVRGTGLLGRLPRPQPGERFEDLLTVHDPGKSVSKTHLELGRDGDDLWVSDRFSGNGTVIRHIDGSIRRCEPGRRYRVERGARVDIGEQFFLVQ